MTDTELLDALQELTDRRMYTGKVILRYSTRGRGWRLHESPMPEAVSDVRQAILDFVQKDKLSG